MSEKSLPALIEALHDADERARRSAVQALGEIGDPSAVPALLETFTGSDSDLRHDAAEALGEIGDTSCLPALTQALADPRSDVRACAADALGVLGDPAAVPALLEALKDSDSYVRSASAEALGWIGSPEGAPGLVAALGDRHTRLRILAAEALEKIGPPSVPALEAALGHANEQVRQSARDTLARIRQTDAQSLADHDQVYQGDAEAPERDAFRGFPAGIAIDSGTPSTTVRVLDPAFNDDDNFNDAHGSLPVTRFGDHSGTPKSCGMTIHYVTDRRSARPTEAGASFSGARALNEQISYGTCLVSIPPDHVTANMETPSIWRLEFTEDPAKHVAVLKVASQEEGEFYRGVARAVAASRNQEAFVFIHGYNVKFRDAARRAAQLAFDLQFDGAPILYSWPSRGTLQDYPTDEDSAKWTVPHLTKFLKDLPAVTGASTVHLIAHSMGNRALVEALEALSRESEAPRAARFRHVVLTAPDIDAGVFAHLASAIRGAADRITVYSSPNDRALIASRRFHGGEPRAGERPLVIQGVDAIDASAVNTDFIGHSYFGDNRTVISDIFHLLKDGKPPVERFTLFAVEAAGGVFYRFRP